MPIYRQHLGDETGRIIRSQRGWLEWRFAPGDTAEIVNIEVQPQCRHQGEGRAMIKQLTDHCKVMSPVRFVYAITHETNRIAQQFYVGCGFRVVGVLRKFYGKELDAVMYGMDL